MCNFFSLREKIKGTKNQRESEKNTANSIKTPRVIRRIEMNSDWVKGHSLMISLFISGLTPGEKPSGLPICWSWGKK